MNNKKLAEPEFILEIENPVRLSLVELSDGIFFNPKFTSERRLRTYVYELLIKAKAFLPENYNFVIYEGLRSKEAQMVLWEEVTKQKKQEHPNLDESSEEFISLCNIFVANPHRQGSGHQTGAAIDISLTNDKGVEYDMGGEVRGFGAEAAFNCPTLSKEAQKNRKILKSALEKVGLINYPSEWWHYSFGDRLWARLTGSNLAIFANI